MTDDRLRATPDEPIVAEGRRVPLTSPKGLRRVPRGVDELATEHLIVNMGPQHPSTHGVLHILLELDGEVVMAAEASLGYLHRGIEKLAESRRHHQVGTLLDRADYVSGIHTELAYAMAVERLMEIEVPEKAHWLRTLMGEINRITSHVLFVGTFGMDTGSMPTFLYTMREREALVDILEAVTGSRMMFNYVRPGGVTGDLPAGIIAKLETFLADVDMYLDEYDVLLTDNEIFGPRTKGVGVIDGTTAVAFGMTGAPLRATGVAWDIRKAHPYASYAELDFDVPLGSQGDCFDRYVVKTAEIRESLKMIRQLIAGVPEGPHMAKVPKVLRPPAGEVYAAVESPRGELGIHLVSDGSDLPYRMRLRSPAYYNLAVIDEALAGGLIADAVVTLGSLDIILGEIDR